MAVIVTLFSNNVVSQGKRVPALAGREEFIEVEKNVKLHVTDLGNGQPIVLIQGWPLSNAMYEYQYQYFEQKGFRAIGISFRGFGKSDKPYGRYDGWRISTSKHRLFRSLNQSRHCGILICGLNCLK